MIGPQPGEGVLGDVRDPDAQGAAGSCKRQSVADRAHRLAPPFVFFSRRVCIGDMRVRRSQGKNCI